MMVSSPQPLSHFPLRGDKMRRERENEENERRDEMREMTEAERCQAVGSGVRWGCGGRGK